VEHEAPKSNAAETINGICGGSGQRELSDGLGARYRAVDVQGAPVALGLQLKAVRLARTWS
jgi:hypothetical protein